jgi:predicted Zn-ribbon and HTH transcriptional regulator
MAQKLTLIEQELADAEVRLGKENERLRLQLVDKIKRVAELEKEEAIPKTPKKEWMDQFEKDIAIDAMHWYQEAVKWKAAAKERGDAYYKLLETMPKIPNNKCLKCGITARKLGVRFTWICPACKAEGWTYIIKTKEIMKKRK